MKAFDITLNKQLYLDISKAMRDYSITDCFVAICAAMVDVMHVVEETSDLTYDDVTEIRDQLLEVFKQIGDQREQQQANKLFKSIINNPNPNDPTRNH